MTELATIYGFPDYVISNDGRVFREFKPDITPLGYRRFTLRDGEGRPKKVEAARAVLSTFRSPPPFHKAEAAHLDGDPTNNSVENLEWKTHIDNMADRIRHGTLLIGEKNHNSKLSDAQALECLELWDSGDWSLDKLAAKYNVTKQTIWYLKQPYSPRRALYEAQKAALLDIEQRNNETNR